VTQSPAHGLIGDTEPPESSRLQKEEVSQGEKPAAAGGCACEIIHPNRPSDSRGSPRSKFVDSLNSDAAGKSDQL
jgi:hypothetical protein